VKIVELYEDEQARLKDEADKAAEMEPPAAEQPALDAADPLDF
jgi:hypothetical protein